MARYIRLAGLASLVLVDRRSEIDELIGHPMLDRDFTPGGPLVNRILLSRARRGVTYDGHVLLSFRPRDDPRRQTSQRELFAQLDALAERRPWSQGAISALATYVATGEERDAALAALAYVSAFPFLEGANDEKPMPFDVARFMPLYRLYQTLSTARRPAAGFLKRLFGVDKRARRQLQQAVGGSDYGVHAVEITLANSVLVLGQFRALASRRKPEGRPDRLIFDWSSIRTAPRLVVRQIKSPCTLPGLPMRLPAATLVLLYMRRGLEPTAPAGYEFASAHWSACPARRYIMSVFATVSDAAVPVAGNVN